MLADPDEKPERPEPNTRERADQWLADYKARLEQLKAAAASGPVVSIPLTGAAEPPDPARLEPVDPAQLAEMLGRQPTVAELAVAPAMLADVMAWAADPVRHRQFLETELHAWTAAYADRDADTNPYVAEDADKDLRMVWIGAYFRALAALARARHAASAVPLPRTIRFWSPSRGRAFGTVTLTPDGQLEYSDDVARQMLSGRVHMFGPEGAFLSYVNWSNGYVCASEI